MARHLYELIRLRAGVYPQALAIASQDGLSWRTLDSRQTLDRVDRLADELAAAGVHSGDRVVLWLPSHWRTPVFLFALWKLGAIAVPFDREMNPEAGRRILASVEPRLILTGYTELPDWAMEQALTEWWEPGSRSATAPDATSWNEPDEDLALIAFTSGTTGNPKGCMISHVNLCSQVDALAYTIPLDPSCRLASILPLSHLFELTVGLLYPLSRGAAIHYIPSRRGPDVVRVLREQEITHMVAVPQLLLQMGRTLEERVQASVPAPVYPLLTAVAARLPLAPRRSLFWSVHRQLGGHLRMFASGGAALAPETQVLWERLGVRVVQGYGCSECSPVVACGAEDGSTPIGSVGRPLRGVDVRLGAGKELLVKGPNVMRGYWKDPEHTAEVLKDGWYATGDLATIDAAGNIRLQGRARDLIVMPSGLNVWPEDVEDVLRAEPAVKDAAVVPVPAAGGRITLHAYLLPARPVDREMELSALISRCNGHLAQHQRIATASWWPAEDFPRTPLGKVRRVQLPQPEPAQAVRVESVLVPDDPVAHAVAAVAHVLAVEQDQTLGQLGLDSFAFVELALEIEEKTGKAIDESQLSGEMSVAALRTLVAAAPERDMEGTDLAAESGSQGGQPIWPYTWGRIFRFLGSPFDLLFRLCTTRVLVLGGEHLDHLPRRVILAGTHHSYADLPLLRAGLARTAARGLSYRLAIATSAAGFADAGAVREFARLAFGLYPLPQRLASGASLRGLTHLAERGNAILIFPQGGHVAPEHERSGAPDSRFLTGAARLATALSAALVPFGLAGTERLLPPTSRDFRGWSIGGVPLALARGRAAIAFGGVLTPEPDETPEALTRRLEQACFALTRSAEAALAAEEHRNSGPQERPAGS